MERRLCAQVNFGLSGDVVRFSFRVVIAKAQSRAVRSSAAGLFVFAVAFSAPRVSASSLEPTTEAQDFAAAAGVCRGRVVSLEGFRHPARGGIFTRVRLEVLESIKGSFPRTVTVIQRGGSVGGEGESNGLAADFRAGEEYLLHLGRRPDGTLAVLRGGDGATLLQSRTRAVAATASGKLARLRQLARREKRAAALPGGEDFAQISGSPVAASAGATSASGLLVDVSSVPSRFIAPDRGERIGYLVDAQTLPDGISLEAALQAVTNALAAWSVQTGLTFRFDGLVNFGMSAADVSAADGRLRISLHDSYGEIASSTTLGIGGRAYVFSGGFGTTGGDGGAVDGLEFHKTTRGYVVLEHTATTMQDPKSFEEVLCHEIGHALGMAHSSENLSETDPVLKEAMMYFRVHKDGRGATLGDYDIPVIRKIHPHDDTPPFSDDRILTLVTSPAAITGIPGINEVRLAAHDLQSPSSSLVLVTTGREESTVPPVASGSFAGNLLRVTQTANYPDGTANAAAGESYYRKYVRFSDGANSSPWVNVRVVAIRRDSQGDGLPDSWSTQYFATSTPSAAALSRPTDDRDKDGLTNLQEFLFGTVPVDANSRLAVRSFDGQTIQWNASPYALYTLESSDDLAGWQPFGWPVVPATTNGSVRVDLLPSASPKKFLRVRFGHAVP